MAGEQRLVIPRLTYAFTNLASGSSQEIVLAKAVEVIPYREAVLITRFYSPNNFNSGGQQITVSARAEAPSVDNPDLDFVGGSDLAAITITSSTAGGEYFVNVPPNFGSHLRLVLKGFQGPSGVGVTFTATLSVVLSLKD